MVNHWWVITKKLFVGGCFAHARVCVFMWKGVMSYVTYSSVYIDNNWNKNLPLTKILEFWQQKWKPKLAIIERSKQNKN